MIDWKIIEVDDKTSYVECRIEDVDFTIYTCNSPMFSIDDGDVFHNIFKMEKESEQEEKSVKSGILFISKNRKNAGVIYSIDGLILSFEEKNGTID